MTNSHDLKETYYLTIAVTFDQAISLDEAEEIFEDLDYEVTHERINSTEALYMED
jgi:hypothetical protein